jgi:small GTP-binding protein
MSQPFENNPTEETLDIKITVLGNTLVGKSALTYRYTSNKFPEDHDTTIEDQYKIKNTIEGYQCQIEILDTAGQDDYQSMLDTWISFGEGFVLVYSIDQKESFDVLKDRYERIKRNKDEDKVPVIIVGNKCDLEDKRKVMKEEVQNYAKNEKIQFMEASALKNINVKEVFTAVATEVVKKKKKIKDTKGDKCCSVF